MLDADSSQHRAISRVLGGESLVIQVPLGTGKSQTIANLIAALLARGKRVLFVAQKRAAIEAVTKRLEQVGLDDLVMDMHGGVTSRREFARTLAESLDLISRIPEPDFSATPLRLTRRSAERLSPQEFEQLAGEIEEWSDLQGHVIRERHPEWEASTIETTEDVLNASDLIRDLHSDRLPEVRDLLAAALDELGLDSRRRSVNGRLRSTFSQASKPRWEPASRSCSSLISLRCRRPWSRPNETRYCVSSPGCLEASIARPHSAFVASCGILTPLERRTCPRSSSMRRSNLRAGILAGLMLATLECLRS